MFNLKGTEYQRLSDVDLDEANVSYEALRRKLNYLCPCASADCVTIGKLKSIPGATQLTGEEFELIIMPQDDDSANKLKQLVSKARKTADGYLMQGEGETYTHWADGEIVTDEDFG